MIPCMFHVSDRPAPSRLLVQQDIVKHSLWPRLGHATPPLCKPVRNGEQARHPRFLVRGEHWRDGIG